MAKSTIMSLFIPLLLIILPPVNGVCADMPIIIDHTCTNIWQIPESAILQAKNTLRIAYAHTSHGSQLISGMGSSGTQLDTFMTNNGAPSGLYVWHDGPQAGALDLDDYFVAGDLGNPDRLTWATRTRVYLDDSDNANVNIVIWSWCGQVSGSESDIDTYLSLMNQLEIDYPEVTFVYMTGHLDGSGQSGNVNVRNNQIRAYCIANNKILYDFADIESYDPDGQVNYMELDANDNCDYDSDGNGTRDTNWAIDWQSSHVENVDWWASGASHSQHLNGNRKGYAAWWLWATIAGFTNPNPIITVTPTSQVLTRDAGTAAISVSNTGTGTMYWASEVTSGSSWLSIISGSSTGSITCAFLTNTTASKRTGTVRITAAVTGSPVDVTLIQMGTPGLTDIILGLQVLVGMDVDISNSLADADGNNKVEINDVLANSRNIAGL